MLELEKLAAVRDTRQKVDGLKVFGAGKDMESAANIHGKRDQESLKPKPKFNIRKSLAWDSAFFTSPGMIVLLKKKTRSVIAIYEEHPIPNTSITAQISSFELSQEFWIQKSCSKLLT